MDFFQLKDISERFMELVNPTSPEKVLKIGEVAGLKAGNRVIDFGSGFGEVLALWAERFRISGVGIDIREAACERARLKLRSMGMQERIKIVAGNAADFRFEPHTFDLAACIGATFIWSGGFREALQRMKRAVKPGGKLAVGEAYWSRPEVPPEFQRTQEGMHTEVELLQIAHSEGWEIEYMVRAGRDDWDRYEAGNWHGLVQWIYENPDHPDIDQVVAHLHESQEEYFRYGREYFGWAIYLLTPAL